jgi:hypothetical protein
MAIAVIFLIYVYLVLCLSFIFPQFPHFSYSLLWFFPSAFGIRFCCHWFSLCGWVYWWYTRVYTQVCSDTLEEAHTTSHSQSRSQAHEQITPMHREIFWIITITSWYLTMSVSLETVYSVYICTIWPLRSYTIISRPTHRSGVTTPCQSSTQVWVRATAHHWLAEYPNINIHCGGNFRYEKIFVYKQIYFYFT